VILLAFSGCFNPFSPSLDVNPNNSQSLIGDQKNIEGIFKNFKYAYTFKDTMIYGKLLSDDFVFVYRDYDKGYDVSWGRDEDVRITNSLINSTQNADLIWNNIVYADTSDLITANVIRGFNLTLTFNPTDIIRIDGRVNLTLERKTASDNWQISRWRDESNF
jgi:hypothetical protein